MKKLKITIHIFVLFLIFNSNYAKNKLPVNVTLNNIFKNIFILSKISSNNIKTEKLNSTNLNSTNNIEVYKDIYTKILYISDKIKTESLDANVTGNLTGDINGSASLNILKTGDTMTGNLTVTTANGNLNGDVTGSLNGNVTGNVNGNLIGNVTGQVYGDLTGDVTGSLIGTTIGNLNGDVTGKVYGSLMGNVTGDIYGDFTGNVNGNVYGGLIGTAKGNFFGDLIGTVTGNANGNLTGDVTGYVYGAASQNILKSGGTITGRINLNGESNINGQCNLSSLSDQSGMLWWQLSKNQNLVYTTGNTYDDFLWSYHFSKPPVGTIITFINLGTSSKPLSYYEQDNPSEVDFQIPKSIILKGLSCVTLICISDSYPNYRYMQIN